MHNWRQACFAGFSVVLLIEQEIAMTDLGSDMQATSDRV